MIDKKPEGLRMRIVVTIVALLLAGAGCSGAAALPPTTEPIVAPTVDPQTKQLVAKVLELSERLELLERQLVSQVPEAADPLEEFNRVYRACYMSWITDEAGTPGFPSLLVFQECSLEDQEVFLKGFLGLRGLSTLAQRTAISTCC